MRYKTSFLLLFVFILSFTNHVNASNTQGFEWGIEVGDQFNYLINYINYSNFNGSFTGYVEVVNLSIIPDVVTKSVEIGTGIEAFKCYYTNGTETYFPWAALPIGNWTLINEIFSAEIPSNFNGSKIDNTAIWGYAFDTPIPDSPFIISEFHFSKTDGVQNYVKAIFSWKDSTASMEIIREGYNPSLGRIDFTMILVISTLGVVIVIILVYMRRR